MTDFGTIDIQKADIDNIVMFFTFSNVPISDRLKSIVDECEKSPPSPEQFKELRTALIIDLISNQDLLANIATMSPDIFSKITKVAKEEGLL